MLVNRTYESALPFSPHGPVFGAGLMCNGGVEEHWMSICPADHWARFPAGYPAFGGPHPAPGRRAGKKPVIPTFRSNGHGRDFPNYEAEPLLLVIHVKQADESRDWPARSRRCHLRRGGRKCPDLPQQNPKQPAMTYGNCVILWPCIGHIGRKGSLRIWREEGEDWARPRRTARRFPP